jgi:hypothetical protein
MPPLVTEFNPAAYMSGLGRIANNLAYWLDGATYVRGFQFLPLRVHNGFYYTHRTRVCILTAPEPITPDRTLRLKENVRRAFGRDHRTELNIMNNENLYRTAPRRAFGLPADTKISSADLRLIQVRLR